MTGRAHFGLIYTITYSLSCVKTGRGCSIISARAEMKKKKKKEKRSTTTTWDALVITDRFIDKSRTPAGSDCGEREEGRTIRVVKKKKKKPCRVRRETV